ncbi:MAG: hypothetical protein Q9165_001315, partial [Trypethelium subeluteriae]
VPTVSKTAATVKQYARSPQWYHERPNRPFTAFEKWRFRWVPLWARWERLKLFLQNDALVETYMPGPLAAKKRTMVEENAKRYIHSMVPEKYRDFIVPDFPLGCKRRIFDPGYLESLNAPNVELIPEGIKEITEDGIISEHGTKDEFDIIVLATGFQVQNFLTPMDIVGEHGVSLRQRWKENRAAQAYLGTTVSGFPNFGILFGPNTFPAHNSALYSCEVQVEYFARTILAPVIDRQVKAMVVHEAAETFWVNSVQKQLIYPNPKAEEQPVKALDLSTASTNCYKTFEALQSLSATRPNQQMDVKASADTEQQHEPENDNSQGLIHSSSIEPEVAFPGSFGAKATGQARVTGRSKLRQDYLLRDWLDVSIWKSAFIELVGTAALCYTSGLIDVTLANLQNPDAVPAYVGISNIVLLALFIYATAPGSGGHINPVISFSTFLTGLTTLPRAVWYMVGQLVGAGLAGGLLRGSLGKAGVVK